MADARALDLARAKWRSSGIPDEAAARLGLDGLDAELTAALGPSFYHTESLFIPYYGMDGAATQFFRVRYTGPLPGLMAQVERPQRYAQAPGTLNDVYLAKCEGLDWQDVAADVDRSVILTEGELKAAAATLRGFPTLGLGGVDCWRASKRGVAFLPTLEAFKWNNRRVYVVFDSDACSNVNVVRAQRQLAEALTGRGARVAIVGLPAAEDGSKQGLDDYLLHASDESFAAMLANAAPWDESRALWEMNEEVLYVRDPGIVVEVETGRHISPKDFVSHAYANRHFMEQKQTAQGVTLVRKPLAKHWLEWEGRHERAGVTYAPGEPHIVGDKWNTWRGWGVYPEAGDVHLWTELLDHLFKGKPDERKWFEQWCAYPLQNPGTKLYSSVLMWGVNHGSGKTMVGYHLARIYGRNAVEIRNRDLQGAFNSWACDKQFVIGDEITSSDKRNEADRIKGLITQDTMRINKKYLPEYVVPDCINYYFTSNHPDALFLEDDDRRFFVHEVVSGTLTPEFYAEYDKWYRQEKGGKGAAHLFHHLLHLDLTGFNPAAPAMRTDARASMVLDMKSDVGMFVQMLLDDPETVLRPLGTKVAKECDLFTSAQLLQAYRAINEDAKVTANGLGRELHRRGIRQVRGTIPVRTAQGMARLYAVRNSDKWLGAYPKDAADHFNQHFPAMPGAKF